MAAARQLPTPPADLVGLTGEMRLIEMACLTGLSSSAGKSAGLIMHEEVLYLSCVSIPRVVLSFCLPNEGGLS